MNIINSQPLKIGDMAIMEPWFIIFVISVILFVVFSTLYDQKHKYTQDDLKLTYFDNNDGSYYFQIKVHIWQYNKFDLLKKLYKPGTIFKYEYDNSTHIIERFGNINQGILKIYARPYIDESHSIININVNNYGTFNLSLVNSTEIQQLIKEINNNYITEPDSNEIITILEEINQHQKVSPNRLDKLLKFITKYESLINIGSSLIQTITAIISLFGI